MAKISLLEFFRTGRFGGVTVGMSRQEVEALLGRPDSWSRLEEYGTAGIWIYGGVELCYSSQDNNLLQSIYFRPSYFTRRESRRSNKRVDTWIFGMTPNGPSKHQLEEALRNASIPFQDTGLEMIFHEEDHRTWQVLDYDPARFQELGDRAECFGTLVLRSGVQVRYSGAQCRYSEEGEILVVKISKGEFWGFPGKEAHIRW
jgi:hypothetical protein